MSQPNPERKRGERPAMFCTTCNFDLHGLTTTTCPECGHAFDPTDPHSFLAKPTHPAYPIMRRAVHALAILVVCGIVIGIGLVIYSAHISFLAEDRLQTAGLVCDLVAEYVEKCPTHSWPTSWKDLESLPPRERMHAWPGEADIVRSMVVIDFTVTTKDVLQQNPQTFTAITMTPGPNYSSYPQQWFYGLLDRVQAATQSPPSPAPINKSEPKP